MAQRRVEIGEKIRLRHGTHKGKLGTVTAHERHTIDNTNYGTYYGVKVNLKILLTYVVDVEGVGFRRVPGSYLDLV